MFLNCNVHIYRQKTYIETNVNKCVIRIVLVEISIILVNLASDFICLYYTKHGILRYYVINILGTFCHQPMLHFKNVSLQTMQHEVISASHDQPLNQ